MILCDIGNSFFHFYEDGRIWKISTKNPPIINKGNKKLYFISVNDKATAKLLKIYPDAINLNLYPILDTDYRGLGIDRAVACRAISDGVIIDAGSAITVDIVQNNTHLGGYILPGLQKYKDMYAQISPKLKKALHFDVAIDVLPQNTADAISYGIVFSIISLLQKSVKNKKIYFTGGDGPFFSRFFKNAIVDNSLIFRGMLKIIKGGAYV